MRAAALSVGIFMMTGAAGATPGLLAPSAYLDIAERLSAKAVSEFQFDTLKSGSLSPSSGTFVSKRPPVAVRSTQLRLIDGFTLRAVALGGRLALEGAPRSFGDKALEVDLPTFGSTLVTATVPGSYVLAATGLSTLPFIRPRRLGPVPFE